MEFCQKRYTTLPTPLIRNESIKNELFAWEIRKGFLFSKSSDKNAQVL